MLRRFVLTIGGSAPAGLALLSSQPATTNEIKSARGHAGIRSRPSSPRQTCSPIRKLAEKKNDGEPDLKILREFCHDVVVLRRGDHSATRLKMEQERLKRDREETEEETEEEAVEHFKRWANNPKVREAICGKCLSPEEREARIREIYGRPPEPTVEAAPAASGSNLVKPNPTNVTAI